MASDIVNGFLGAAYGAYIGTLVYLNEDILFSWTLFSLIFINLMGTLQALNREELSASSAVMAVWGINFLISLVYPAVASRVFLGALIGTLWVLLFLPHILDRWIEGRPG